MFCLMYSFYFCLIHRHSAQNSQNMYQYIHISTRLIQKLLTHMLAFTNHWYYPHNSRWINRNMHWYVTNTRLSATYYTCKYPWHIHTRQNAIKIYNLFESRPDQNDSIKLKDFNVHFSLSYTHRHTHSLLQSQCMCCSSLY